MGSMSRKFYNDAAIVSGVKKSAKLLSRTFLHTHKETL